MLITTLCLASRPAVDAPLALGRVAKNSLGTLAGLRQVQVNRVLRQIPTDYISNDKPYRGVVAEADRIDLTMDLQFADAAAATQAVASPAWAELMGDVQVVAEVLFALDAEPNIPVALSCSAVDGRLSPRAAPHTQGQRARGVPRGLVCAPREPRQAPAAARRVYAKPGEGTL